MVILINLIKFLFLYSCGMSISFYIISLFYKDSKIEDLKELIEDSKNIEFIEF